MKTKLGICIALFVASIATSVQAQSTYFLYDDFASKTIDPDRWVALENRPSGIQMLDSVRDIEKGTLHMLNYFYGDTSANTGYSSGANRVVFPDSSGMTGLIAKVQIQAYALNGCPANNQPADVRARIGGDWFNTGIPTLGSSEGNVTTTIYPRRRSNSTDGVDVFEVVATVNRCNDPDCTTGTSLGSFGANVLGTVKKGKWVTLRVEWDQVNHRFIFQRDKQPEVYINYKQSANWDPAWDDTQPPLVAYGGYMRLEARGQVPTCEPTEEPRPMVFIEAKFDDIYIK